MIRTFLEIQMELALSKGSISPAERKVLWRIADTGNPVELPVPGYQGNVQAVASRVPRISCGRSLIHLMARPLNL